MKAKDLMIGDWVTYCGVPIQIEQILPTTGDEAMLPIPITEEILKANGFIKRGESTFYYGELFKFHVVVWIFKNENPEENDIVIEVSNDLKKRGVNNAHVCEDGYVHILQHALRLCGLNKLDDNFKIE